MNIKKIDVSGHEYDICDAKMREAMADEYDVLSTYKKGDFCIFDNAVYRCIEETTGAWQETKWEKKTFSELYKEMEIMTHISDAFSASKEYAAGKYCIYANTLYKFTAAKTAGAWDPQKVAATSVDAELSALNANIGNLIKTERIVVSASNSNQAVITLQEKPKYILNVYCDGMTAIPIIQIGSPENNSFRLVFASDMTADSRFRVFYI